MNNQKTTDASFPLFGLTVNFILFSMVGILVAFTYSASKPPQAVSGNQLQKDLNEDNNTPAIFQTQKEVLYHKTMSVGRRSEALSKKLFSSTSNQIEITANDLNAWANQRFSSYNNTNTSDEKPSISFEPEKPGFHIAPQKLHINYPVTINAFGKKIKLLVLCAGTFETKNMTPVWKMSSLSINSAPIPLKTLVYNFIKPRILNSFSENEETEKLRSAWNIIKEIELTDSSMIIHRK